MNSKTFFDTSRDRLRATLLAFGVGTLMVCVLIGLLLSSHPQVVKLVNLFYLASTAGLGLWLYVSNPPLYLSFVWWMWLVSPFVRRLVDYQLDMFTPPQQALILLAPYVVTALSAFTLFRYGRLLLTKAGAPFLFGLLAVLYGYIVGLPLNGGMSASLGLLEWLPPLLLGFHVYALWRQYPEHRQIIRSTFLGAALVLGTYGLIQFFVLPPWDAFWMVGSRMNSIGPAEPLADGLDRVLQDADILNLDSNNVVLPERHVFRGDDGCPREKNRHFGNIVTAPEVRDQLLAGPDHLTGGRTPLKDGCTVPFDRNSHL